jgi:hypothetical protein
LLSQAGFTPEFFTLRPVALDAVDDGFEISVIKLHLTGEVSGMTEAHLTN